MMCDSCTDLDASSGGAQTEPTGHSRGVSRGFSRQDVLLAVGFFLVLYCLNGEHGMLVCNAAASAPAVWITYRAMTAADTPQSALKALLGFWVLFAVILPADHLFGRAFGFFAAKLLLLLAAVGHVAAKSQAAATHKGGQTMEGGDCPVQQPHVFAPPPANTSATFSAPISDFDEATARFTISSAMVRAGAPADDELCASCRVVQQLSAVEDSTMPPKKGEKKPNEKDEYLASRWSRIEPIKPQDRKARNKLIRTNLDLTGEEWPADTRVAALTALGDIFEKHSALLVSDEGVKPLSCLCQRLLLLLNSDRETVQQSSADVLYSLIRQGYNKTMEYFVTQEARSAAFKRPPVSAEWLGSAGLQLTTVFAQLLGRNQLSANCVQFADGLRRFGLLVSTNRKSRRFRKAASDLCQQLWGLLEATKPLLDATNDPVLLAELHVRLADEYRAHPALRSRLWYSEAAVCQAHCAAIIAKQLSLRGELEVDFSLFDRISRSINEKENLRETPMMSVQSYAFTLKAFTSKVEELAQTLQQCERYEAIGPLYRLVIPLYEQQANHRGLEGLYGTLHTAYDRAAEIQKSGKRQLATYFRLASVLDQALQDHGLAFVIREPGFTSLAEACERMVEFYKKKLDTENVRFLTEDNVTASTLDPEFAYIQVTHVEPFCLKVDSNLPTENEFEAHVLQMQRPEVNYAAAHEPKESFPNPCRRQLVVSSCSRTLNPLMLAIENLHRKTVQIQRILQTADILPSGSLEGSKLEALDMKGLQLILQGTIFPSVNAGVLAYAEAFTTETQRARYGNEGIEKLKEAFHAFVAQAARALAVNEAVILNDQMNYQQALKNAFYGMVEKLSLLFDGESFNPERLSLAPTTNTSFASNMPRDLLHASAFPAGNAHETVGPSDSPQENQRFWTVFSSFFG
ncbi:DOCKER domain-containing protein [Aphelenchoides fujianensis]|nr:DOCKER domain-containing protein [Aphelenchoides fujianensis]